MTHFGHSNHFSVTHFGHSNHFSVTRIGLINHFSLTRNGHGNHFSVTTSTRMMKKKLHLRMKMRFVKIGTMFIVILGTFYTIGVKKISGETISFRCEHYHVTDLYVGHLFDVSCQF